MSAIPRAPRLALSLVLAQVLAACSTSSAGKKQLDAGPETGSEIGASGWTDLTKFLVVSDGSHSLGNAKGDTNPTRDQGSKIAYFNSEGNNATADVYWWDGTRLVDSQGLATNPANGRAYGSNPLSPDEAAIKPFKQAIGMNRNGEGDARLRTLDFPAIATAPGFADWFLFRRGQVHDTFDGNFLGGRSERAPVVTAAYGPLGDGRAIMAPVVGKTVTYGSRRNQTVNPFQFTVAGGDPVWMHMALVGLDMRAQVQFVEAENATSNAGGPVTALIEDCAWNQHQLALGSNLLYMPRKTTVRRTILANAWSSDEAHSMGYYTSGFKAEVTFDEVIFYRNGYHSDPATEPDPPRDSLSRNVYQGGGAWMGHNYRNIISADGSSGGPQMRLGGLCENSLIVEGYWYSTTHSNSAVNDWMTEDAQKSGNPSAIVRNNVQLVFGYPSPNDPDSKGKSSTVAQPAWGYSLGTAAFGSSVTGNIITDAMRLDELGASPDSGSYGLSLAPQAEVYADGISYTEKNNTISDNIVYRTHSGLRLEKSWAGVQGNRVEGNVFASRTPIEVTATDLKTASQLLVKNNRFYSDTPLPSAEWLDPGNTQAPLASAAASEGWPDPDRTLKRYVTEELGLTLLDWEDDPFLTSRDTGAYDPIGLKTFMAVATNMRHGGKTPAPSSGKPSWTGDYDWDERFTGKAVVNWIRKGFGLAVVP